MERPLPPFLRGRVDGVGLVASAWIRGLEEVRETVDRWAGGLPPEGFWWVPGPGLNPIGGLVRHIAGSCRRLLYYALGEPVPEELMERARGELQPEPQLPPEPVLQQFHQELSEVQERLRGIREADLEAVRPIGRRQVPVEAAFALHHLVEHAQHHAGQIIVLRKLWEARARSG